MKHTKGIDDSIPDTDEYNSFPYGVGLNVTKTVFTNGTKIGKEDGMQMSYLESRWSFDKSKFELYRGDWVKKK